MARTLNSTAQALLTAAQAGTQIAWAQLVEISTDDETLRLTTAGWDITWGGFTWTRGAVTVEPIDDQRGELQGLVISLPAVDESQLALALTADLEGATLRVYDAMIDPTTGVVADAPLAWSGTLNVPGIEDGATARISITAEHRGVAALRPKVSRYTEDEQRRLYSGDTSLAFDPATDAGPLVWPAAGFFRQ